MKQIRSVISFYMIMISLNTITYCQDGKKIDAKVEGAWISFKGFVLNSQTDSVLLSFNFPFREELGKMNKITKKEFLKR